MNLHLHFILINSEFNTGLAEDLYEGEETEDNIKHLWEDEFRVAEQVQDFKIKNRTNYTLAGYYPNDEEFSFDIPDMTVVECTTISGSVMQFAVSKKLLKKTEKVVNEKADETHLHFYLRDDPPMENPMNGVYILKSDFPKELKKTKSTEQSE